jgi:hypothetical protein
MSAGNRKNDFPFAVLDPLETFENPEPVRRDVVATRDGDDHGRRNTLTLSVFQPLGVVTGRLLG